MYAPLQLREPSSRRFDFTMLDSGSGRPCHQKALEQVLLSFFSDQELYRQGLRFTTTLDKPLQDSLVASLATGTVPAGDVPDRIIVLKEGGDPRALLHGDRETGEVLPGVPRNAEPALRGHHDVA